MDRQNNILIKKKTRKGRQKAHRKPNIEQDNLTKETEINSVDPEL